MKKLLLLGGLLCLFTRAHAVNLEWDANTATVAGYRIYFGPDTQVYTDAVDFAHSLTGFIPTPSGKPYHFAVVAYNAAGLESDFSDDLLYEPHDVLIESCDVLDGTWHILRHDVLDFACCIYRLRLGKDQTVRVQVSDDDGVSWGDKITVPVSFVPEHQFFRMTVL